MITRVPENQYLNIFETAWLVAAAEFIMAMNFIKVYDMETDEWNTRRIFWYLAGLLATVPALIAVILGIVAAVKYLVLT
jgi:quinol-cytochrome oxidoreductase complex cytochrome b subunit